MKNSKNPAPGSSMPTNEFSGEKSPNPIVVKVINEKYMAYGNTSYGVWRPKLVRVLPNDFKNGIMAVSQ